MARTERSPYYLATRPFPCDGEKQFVEVLDGRQTIRRLRCKSTAPIDETICPKTRAGCYIHDIAASPSGTWLVTQRISGAGEWGYDVFRTSPLVREAGIAQERGYLLELPRFANDEAFLVGAAGWGFLGGWWAHPDDEPDQPARGGVMTLGFLFVHRLPSHRMSRHQLRVKVPKGWMPDDPFAEKWFGPQKVAPTANGVRFVTSWGTRMEIKAPLPRVIRLPTPRPSGML